MVASSRSVPLHRWGSWLVFLSLVYLGWPTVLFFGFWLRGPWNVLSVAIVGLLFWQSWPRREQSLSENEERISLKVFWLTLLPCLLALIPSGIGALVPQFSDWHKHNAVFYDLVQRPWPITYQVAGASQDSFYLLYYLGFYLPIAAVSRVLGVGSLPWVTLLWSAMGLGLVSGWIVFFTRGRSAWFGLLFIAFDGLKLLGLGVVYGLIAVGILSKGPLISDVRQLIWWAGGPHFQYSPNFVSLGIVPQHALSGWIGAALLCFAIFHPRSHQTRAIIASVFPFCFLWSVFVGAASIPLTFAALVIRKRHSQPDAGSFRQDILFSLLGICLVGIIGLYYAGRGSTALVQPIPTVPLVAWIGEPKRALDFLVRLVLWTIFEWAVLCWLASRARPQATSAERVLLGISYFLLIALPFFHVGMYNDLLLRGIVPAQFILFLWIANSLQSARMDGEHSASSRNMQAKWSRPLLLVLLVICAVNSAITFRIPVSTALSRLIHLRRTNLDSSKPTRSVADWQKLNLRAADSLESDFDPHFNAFLWKMYRSQYLGRTDSLWWRVFARQ